MGQYETQFGKEINVHKLNSVTFQICQHRHNQGQINLGLLCQKTSFNQKNAGPRNCWKDASIILGGQVFQRLKKKFVQNFIYCPAKISWDLNSWKNDDSVLEEKKTWFNKWVSEGVELRYELKWWKYDIMSAISSICLKKSSGKAMIHDIQKVSSKAKDFIF